MQTYLIKIPQDAHVTAAEFEEVFTQLHESLLGEVFSLELVATAQNIGLRFTASEAISQVIAGQIYAIAPHADIVKINDFTASVPDDADVIGIELGLKKNDLFPLKDFSEFRGDSLSGILSILSKCRPGEDVFIQIVLKPERDSARHHLRLNFRKAIDRVFGVFRVKYWFKRDSYKSSQESILAKSKERLYKTNIRIVVASTTEEVQPEVRLEAVYGAFANFNTLDFNQIKIRKLKEGFDILDNMEDRTIKKPFRLSTKELATFYHLPSEKETPNLIHVLSANQAPPQELPTNTQDPDISFFGETNFRDERIPFGIKRNDRRRHLYVLGKSGSGKSKMLELLVKNDIYAGHGVGVLDPHGDLVDNILRIIPEERIDDVIIFDPSDLAYPPSFNPLEQVPEELKMRVTIGFIEIFQKLFGTNWSPRLEHVLRYTTLALLDTPGTTVLSILKMLTDKKYRQMIVSNIQDNVVKNFWVSEFAAWSEKFDNEAITPLINKVGQFVATNMIRNIVGQPINRFDFRDIMDSRKILLMKVSKGILGEENASLLGAIAVTKIYQAAMSRADILEDDRVDYYFYVDEFHNFATDSFDEILSEARKYRLNLTLANQFLGQLRESIRKTVFGNVGSLLSFRVGAEDAKIIANEFKPRFTDRDIINLGVRDFCIKMSIDGEIKEAFSGRTSKMSYPADNELPEYVDESKKFSRDNYSLPLAEVEEILQRWEEGEYDASSPDNDSDASKEVKFEEPLI